MTSGTSTFSPAIGEARRYTAWVASIPNAFLGESVLEVGLGEGNYFGHFSGDRRYTGIDLDHDLVVSLKERFPERDYRVHDLVTGNARELGGKFESVVCVNVLEHVWDEMNFLTALHRYVEADGTLFLFVPAFDLLYSDMDSRAGHYRRYTARQLSDVMRKAGWQIDTVRYFNPIGAFTWAIQGLAGDSALDSPKVRRRILFFDKWLVPISRCIDPLTSRFIGQSIFAIAHPR